jgi:hypothetical protein
MPSSAPLFAGRRLALLLAGAALSAAAALPVHAKDAPEPLLMDAAFAPASRASSLLKAVEPAVLKDVRRVALPLFTVEFVIADSQQASTSGFGAAGRATQSTSFTLKGVGEPDFQAITDTLYTDLVAQLKAAGIEVLPREQLLASPTYKKLAAAGVASPVRSDSAITVAAGGLPIYGFSKVQGGGSGSGGLFAALSSLGNTAGAIGAAMDTAELNKELGAAVVEVQLRVHFVQLTNDNKGFLGRLSSTASVTAKAYPSVQAATFHVQSGTRGTLTLQNPLMLDASAITEVRKAPTTTGEVAGAVLAGLIRMASGSKDSSGSDAMEAVADPVKYREVVGSGLSNVGQMFVERLRAGS